LNGANFASSGSGYHYTTSIKYVNKQFLSLSDFYCLWHEMNILMRNSRYLSGKKPLLCVFHVCRK